MNDDDRSNLRESAESAYRLEQTAEKNYAALVVLDGFLRDAHDVRRRQADDIRTWLKGIHWQLSIITILLAYIAYKLT